MAIEWLWTSRSDGKNCSIGTADCVRRLISKEFAGTRWDDDLCRGVHEESDEMVEFDIDGEPDPSIIVIILQ